MIRAYWSRSANFGDALTPWLFDQFTSAEVTFARAGSAELFAVGSLLDWIPEGFTGTVLGAGKMRPGPCVDLNAANVLAVRGPLTAAYANVDCDLYGDLGLLCRLYPHQNTGRYKVGVLPHMRDTRLAPKLARKGNLAIDICSPIEQVISQVADCQRIVTSSLHGLILADALGIESRWEQSDAVYGGRFKFDDYHLGMFGTPVPDGWRTADQNVVDARTARLYDALQTVAG